MSYLHSVLFIRTIIKILFEHVNKKLQGEVQSGQRHRGQILE